MCQKYVDLCKTIHKHGYEKEGRGGGKYIHAISPMGSVLNADSLVHHWPIGLVTTSLSLPPFPLSLLSFAKAAYSSTLKMEALGFSETLVPIYQTT
jgi:hypothetical protein